MTTTTTATAPKANVTWTDVDTKGAFVRKDATFRDWIKADGSTAFKPEKGRYHLYVCLACPWAHRTLIVRSLKGLEDVISVTAVDHFLDTTTGWRFVEKDDQVKGCKVEPFFGFRYLREIYKKANPGYEGRITVPVLWDRKLETIVNNESSEIIRMLNSEFNAFSGNPKLDLYPEPLRAKIDDLNSWIYPNINNGVYQCGFAQSQEAYDEAATGLFAALDKLEGILSKNRYLCGNELTEADVRLFTTLIRFDLVYFVHFKCSKKMIKDFPNTFGYLRELYQMPEFKKTVDFDHIRKHYFGSHAINVYRIVPIALDVNFEAPHNRDKMSA